MTMKIERILVLVKQVRESSAPDALWILNPADACAVETALQLKETSGARVTVLTMGREKAEDMLRELIARGVDEACLVTDPAYAGSDTLATARVLHAAANRLGPFDLILTGRRAVDGETALTPARLAQLLGWPLITDIQTVVCSDEFICEDGETQKRLKSVFPAVLTVHEGSCTLRLKGILGMRRAKSAVIRRLTNAELCLPPEQVGLAGSPTCVRRVTNAPESLRVTRWLHSGREIVQTLREHTAIVTTKQTKVSSISKLPGEIWVLAEEEGADSRALVARAQALTDSPVRLLLIAPRENVLPVAENVAKRLREGRPEAVLSLSTPFLRALAPQVATLLETGLTADCTDLQATDSGLLLQIRPTFGGAQLAEILCPEARPQMALVRRGVFPDEGHVPCAVERLAEPENGPIACLERHEGAQSTLSQAKLIVAGGLGVGSKEGFAQLAELAKCLGGEVAATRAAVDAGYAPYRMQVGQTGLTVRPDVYLTFGVSGAIQHVLGMNRSGTVISINNDPKAPVFHYSDFGLVLDWKQALNEIKEELES